MIFKKSCLMIFMLMLASCGENWDKESEETHAPPSPNSPQVYFEPIVEKERVSGETFLANVNEGDIILFTFTGKMLTPTFSQIYERTYRSHWKDRFCEPRDPICPRCDLLKRQICWDINRTGNCNFKYRNFNGRIEQDIFFSDKIDETKLRLKVGTNLYPLGRIIDHEGMVIRSEFSVSKEMLQENNEVSLTVIPDPNLGSIKTGFLGYGSCQGIGRRYFRHEGPTSSTNYENRIKREFIVTAHFKRIKK